HRHDGKNPRDDHQGCSRRGDAAPVRGPLPRRHAQLPFDYRQQSHIDWAAAQETRSEPAKRRRRRSAADAATSVAQTALSAVSPTASRRGPAFPTSVLFGSDVRGLATRDTAGWAACATKAALDCGFAALRPFAAATNSA